MSWKDKMKEWGGGDMAFLSEDGETIQFVVVGEPVLLSGVYKTKPSQKVGCPVVTEDGFELLVAGKRLARKISKYEEQFAIQGFMATRHGEADNPNTRYELTVLTDATLVKRLFDIAKKDFKKEMIKDAVAAAELVMKG